MTDLPVEDRPLDPEPVLGWRAWRLVRRRGELRLVSLTRDDAWPAREAMRARCGLHRGPTVPAASCSCGIYATSTPQALGRAGVFSFDVAVIGAIAMWGTVVMHGRGARATSAYPARLRLVCGRCLASGVGAVDAAWVVGSTLLRPVCADHATPAAGERQPAATVQAELLGVYAVDLLPAERLRRLGRATARPRPPSNLRRGLDAIAIGVIKVIGAVLQILMAMFLISTFVSIAFGIIGTVADLVTGGDEAVAVVTPAPAPDRTLPVVRPEPSDRKDDVDVAASAPAPLPAEIAFPCGRGDGDRVVEADCLAPEADLWGFANREPPEGPATDCVEGWVAYSRGDGYWICWHPRPSHDPDVRPWASAADPFG